MKKVFLSGLGAVILATLISVIIYSLFLVISREASAHFQKVGNPIIKKENPRAVFKLRDSTGKMVTYTPEPMAQANNYVH